MDRKWQWATKPFIFLFAGWWLVTAAPAWSDEPTKQIHATVNQALQVLRDHTLAGEEKREERRAKLREIIYARFDFGQMSQGSLGRRWNSFTPDQQTRFITLFRQILEDTYLNKVESYEGEAFTFTKESQLSEQLSQVDSMVSFHGKEYSLSYRLSKMGTEWKVSDVIIEGVSLVANYRAQFQSILERSSVEDLLTKLDAKVKNSKKGSSSTH